MVCQNERVGLRTGSVGRSAAGDMVEGNASDGLWLRVWGAFTSWKEVVDGIGDGAYVDEEWSLQ